MQGALDGLYRSLVIDGDALDRRDASLVAAVLPLARAFNRAWVRLRVDGLEHLPKSRALLVANHNGGIAGPDLACTFGTLWNHLGPEAPLYALAHDFAMKHVPALGAVLQRFGAVRASQRNAMRLIERDALCLVYPGGDLDAYRDSTRRDEVVLGHRTGFVRVAQQTGAPIVPIVAHGAHRSAWVLSDGETIARALRLQEWARVSRFPIALALPWGISLGPWTPWLPLPFSIRLRVLPPIEVAQDDDPATVREEVRTRMQAALNELSRGPA